MCLKYHQIISNDTLWLCLCRRRSSSTATLQCCPLHPRKRSPPGHHTDSCIPGQASEEWDEGDGGWTSHCAESSERAGELRPFPNVRNRQCASLDDRLWFVSILTECCDCVLCKQAQPLSSDLWFDGRAVGHSLRATGPDICHLCYTRTGWAHGLSVWF